MVTNEDNPFTSDDRNGSRPSLVATTSSMLLDRCFPASRKPQYSTNPATNPPAVGTSNFCQKVLDAAKSSGSPTRCRNSISERLMHLWNTTFTNPPITPTPPASTR